MSDDESDDDGPDGLLDGLTRAKDEAIERCQYRTACRLATEIKRAAKSARRLEPYAWALHTLTNHARNLLDPNQGREAAVELIAVLESEDRARQVQPDLDGGEYERLVSWMSSCAYDNLGKLTAALNGYNSEGLHDAIAEGIQVCRRTGKLECINCFREYASEVFRASDDLPMALHHARHVTAQAGVRPGFDRRWAGSYSEAELLLVMGSIDDAKSAARRAWELCDEFPHPLSARLSTAIVLDTIGLLEGNDEPLAGLPAIGELRKAVPSADEFPDHQLRSDLVLAVGSSLRSDHAAAIRTLTAWDRRLSERQCLDQWFEVRLRLVAAYRLAGDPTRAQAIARPLEEKARPARDWLTLRRLGKLLDQNVPASPIASVNPIVCGTRAVAAGGVAGRDTAEPANVEAEDPPPGLPKTPLQPVLDELETRLEERAANPPMAGSLLDGLVALGPDAAKHPLDVARMLSLAGELCDDPSRGNQIWDWAQAIAAPFPREGTVLNLLAALGDSLRSAENSLVGDRIETNQIEQLFRQSLDLDPDDPNNFGRAAVYYHNSGQLNQAERCLARCVRLDRCNARAVLWLADIYNESDRSADALAILDMALRAGAGHIDIAFQAAVLAHSHGQFEAMLTYLDHVDRVMPGRKWVNYYRASGLIRLGRHAEGLLAIDEEARTTEGPLLHLLILRACASSGLERTDEFRTCLSDVLATKLSLVDYVSHSGLVQLFGRLWDAASILAGDDPLVDRLAALLLATGLAPNQLFETKRNSSLKAEGLSFYVCSLRQPLDERWRQSPGCLHGEEDWPAYRIPWGVLAADESEAAAMTLAWQERCYPLDAEVYEIELQDDGFSDHPGVVWQGLRAQGE
jgi:tetratricopeptide (TPR) repeat protein